MEIAAYFSVQYLGVALVDFNIGINGSDGTVRIFINNLVKQN